MSSLIDDQVRGGYVRLCLTAEGRGRSCALQDQQQTPRCVVVPAMSLDSLKLIDGESCGPCTRVRETLQGACVDRFKKSLACCNFKFIHSSILALVVARYTSSTIRTAFASICILPSPCLRQWPRRRSAPRRTTRKSRQQLDWWVLVRSHPNSYNGRVVADI